MMINKTNKVLYAPDSIHFLDGVENIKSMDMELAFKVDANYENVVKAWSFVINEVTAERREGGQRQKDYHYQAFVRYTYAALPHPPHL